MSRDEIIPLIVLVAAVVAMCYGLIISWRATRHK